LYSERKARQEVPIEDKVKVGIGVRVWTERKEQGKSAIGVKGQGIGG
jgi:hypothetical protein